MSKPLACVFCGAPACLAYPGNDAENGPARPTCKNGHVPCMACGAVTDRRFEFCNACEKEEKTMPSEAIRVTVTFSLDKNCDSGTIYSALLALATARDGNFPAGVVLERAEILNTGYVMDGAVEDINQEAQAGRSTCERCDREIFRPAPGAPSSEFYCSACNTLTGELDPAPYCKHVCTRCGESVSHYRRDCREGYELTPPADAKDGEAHPDCIVFARHDR